MERDLSVLEGHSMITGFLATRAVNDQGEKVLVDTTVTLFAVLERLVGFMNNRPTFVFAIFVRNVKGVLANETGSGIVEIIEAVATMAAVKQPHSSSTGTCHTIETPTNIHKTPTFKTLEQADFITIAPPTQKITVQSTLPKTRLPTHLGAANTLPSPHFGINERIRLREPLIENEKNYYQPRKCEVQYHRTWNKERAVRKWI